MVPDTPPRRYFDNAATTFPKPPGVAAAVAEYLERFGASAGRGAYREAMYSQRLLDECRALVRRLFGCATQDAVVFTLNGTDALNVAIKGLVGPDDHVVTTVMDHNSVLRPLSALRARFGVEWTAVAVDPQSTLVDPDELGNAIGARTRLVVVNHASNVTGALQPLAQIARVCRERGVPLLVDAAQTAGHVPVDLAELGVDLLACPGHKGLLGPLGTGVLVLRGDWAARVRTLREGGTGSRSEQAVQPAEPPDKFEPGSHNAPGLAGLRAALGWILDRGVDRLRAHELALSTRLMAGLDDIPRLRWYGPRAAEARVGVFSVRVDGLEPAEVSAILEAGFGVLTRSGLHCAPLAHQAIGTAAIGGTTRLSLGAFLSETDVDTAVTALAEIASHRRACASP